jgi:large subunit ribosomal protein L21
MRRAGNPSRGPVPEQAGLPVAIQSADVRIAVGPHLTESEFSVYAIVRCSGRQEKASVDDVLTVNRLAGEVGSTLTLPAVLVVDGDNVVTDAEELGGYQVAAEIVGDASGPKINMIRYKNKTGYRRRLGHRQKYTQLRITAITKGGGHLAGKSSGTSEAPPASARTKPAASEAPPASARTKPAASKATPASARTKPAASDATPASARTKPAASDATPASARTKPAASKATPASARTKPAASKAPAPAADEAGTAEES